MSKLPEHLTPAIINAWLVENIGYCGCMGAYPIEDIRIILEWAGSNMDTRLRCDQMYPDDDGVFCLIAGMMEKLDLMEHGAAIRCPWLTPDGERLLAAIKEFTPEAIANAE